MLPSRLAQAVRGVDLDDPRCDLGLSPLGRRCRVRSGPRRRAGPRGRTRGKHWGFWSVVFVPASAWRSLTPPRPVL